ncbi:MAG: hypothetical protein U0X73_07385 [Thermoanaerobaculia bacterium]
MHRFAAVALAGSLVAAPATAGWTFTMKTSNSGSPHAEMADSVTRVALEGGNAKVEFLETRNPMFGKGTYLLMHEQKLYVVEPDKKTYALFDLEAMSNSLASAMSPGGTGMKLTYDDVKVEKLLEEPGGAIAGYSTTHYKFHTSFKQTMSMGPMTIASLVDTVEDSWTTTAISFGEAGSMVSSFGGTQLGKEIQKLIDAQKGKMTGVPLKRISVTKVENQGTGVMAALLNKANGEGPTTTTMEVTELSESAIPAATFAIPAGYSETQLMYRMPGAPDKRHP